MKKVLFVVLVLSLSLAAQSATTASCTGTALATVPGLFLQTNGVVCGTPTSAGTFQFVAQLTDSAGNTAQAVITVPVAQPLTISPPTLPQGVQGQPYNGQLTPSGGSGAGYQFSVAPAK